MRTLCVICLFALATTIGYSQASKDTLVYSGYSRVTTAYSKFYIGPIGVQKQVNITFDTSSSTQTATVVLGLAADTNNVAKKILCRLAYRTSLPTLITFKDSVWIKVDASSVLPTVIAMPYPLSLQR